MEPLRTPCVAYVSLALSDLVCVVGECIVDTAAVNVKIFTEVLVADCRAYDVPAGVAEAPRAFPLKLLILNLRLCEPKNLVGLVLLCGVLLNALSYADGEILRLVLVEDIIFLKL